MEPNMTKTTTLLCAAASAVALYAASAGAAPLSAPLAIKSADAQCVEAVRYHRRHHGRAYYGFGYNSYARARGFRGGGHTCSRGQTGLSAYPSWWCSRYREYQ
jgi:hypothetical protein